MYGHPFIARPMIRTGTPKIWLYLSMIPVLGTYWLLGYYTARHQTASLSTAFAVLYLVYAYWLKNLDKLPAKKFLLLAVVLRLLFVVSTPSLSDDYFRFIWDGELWANGVNPFLFTPRQALEQFDWTRLRELFPFIYGKDFHTVYPPLAQLAFWMAAIFSDDLFWLVLILRVFIYFAEAGTFWLIWRLLKHQRLPVNLIFIYALNPLIILEFSGNLHQEAYVIFFLAAAGWFLIRNNLFQTAVVFSGAILSKLVPLIFLPSLLVVVQGKRAIQMVLLILMICSGAFLLVGGVDIIHGMNQGLSLYYLKFEFNPSVWLLIRPIGQMLTGYNILIYAGPVLAAVSGMIILYLSLSKKNKIENPINLGQLFDRWTLLLSVYLLLSPIVHPWYITPMILFSVFGKFRFTLLWSAMILMTYAGYQLKGYQEQVWLIALEYVLVLVYFIAEWKTQSQKIA